MELKSGWGTVVEIVGGVENIPRPTMRIASDGEMRISDFQRFVIVGTDFSGSVSVPVCVYGVVFL